MTMHSRSWSLLLLPVFLLALPVIACPRVPRSPAVVRQFQRAHVCPSTGMSGRCPGYVVDHIIPLCLGPAAGGLDTVMNMQYQTLAASRAKDVIERQQCRAHPRPCPHQGD